MIEILIGSLLIQNISFKELTYYNREEIQELNYEELIGQWHKDRNLINVEN